MLPKTVLRSGHLGAQESIVTKEIATVLAGGAHWSGFHTAGQLGSRPSAEAGRQQPRRFGGDLREGLEGSWCQNAIAWSGDG